MQEVVLRHGKRHGDDRTLAHRVGEAVSERRGPRDRSHVENYAAAVRLHMANRSVDAVVYALHIYTKYPVEIFLRRRFYRAYMRNARIVHEDVYPRLGKDFLECFADLPLVGNITNMNCRLAASVCD